MMSKLNSCIEKRNNAQWYVFVLLLLAIFVKSIVFNWICFSNIQENYAITLLMSLPQKLVPALFIAGFVFMTKRQWWTIVVNVLVDIWIIANMFYFKANGIFLSYEIMTMAGNMDGFWDSLISLMGWDICVFPIITAIYSILIWGVVSRGKKYSNTCIIVFVGLALTFGDQVIHKALKADKGLSSVKTKLCYCLPFAHAIGYAQNDWMDYNWWSKQYIRKFSIVSYFPSCLIYKCASPRQNVIEIENFDDSRIKPFVSDKYEIPNPQSNIVFILVESLESWALDTINGLNFMPNLNTIIQDDHTLFCKNVKSQTVHGNSADGQLIAVTGLLPITDGVVCKSFRSNTYPSYAECFKSSSIINPMPGAWYQERMTRAYHFKNLIEPSYGIWGDDEVFDEIIQYIDTANWPFCTLGITITSHRPFEYGTKNPKYRIEGMPVKMNAYLNCLAYTDSCIGAVYNHIKASENLSVNTTLVITGDHTVFRAEEKEMDEYAKNEQIDFKSTKTYVPFIVYSPSLPTRAYHIYTHTHTHTHNAQDAYYQMDMYPTIMSLVGCENYYWKGFGVNLLDREACAHRLVEEQEAYELSNLIIKSDYFKKFVK